MSTVCLFHLLLFFTEAKSTYLLCAHCARNLPWKYWNHFVSYSPHCNSVLLRWHCKTLRTKYSSIDLQTNLWTTLFIWLFIRLFCTTMVPWYWTSLHHTIFFFFLLFMIRWLTSVHLTPSGYLPPRVSESRNVAAVFFFFNVVLLEEILYNSCNNNKKNLKDVSESVKAPACG